METQVETQVETQSHKQSIDFNESEQFANCFTTNGSLTIIMIDKTYEGRTDLRQFCSSLHQRFKGCMHFEVRIYFFSIACLIFCDEAPPSQSNIVLKSTKLRNGREAILNRSYWSSLRSDNTVVSMGVHEDVFVKESGEWRCQSRTITHSGKDGPLNPKKAAALSKI